MVLSDTEPLSFGNLRTEFNLPASGPVSLSSVRAWSGAWSGGDLISIGLFKGKSNASYEYPPSTIGTTASWTKDATYFGSTRTQSKTLSSGTYGLGFYKTYTNMSWWSMNTGTIYNSGESAPSAAFTKTTGGGQDIWVTNSKLYISTSDAATPPTLYIELPFPITIRSYQITARTACCANQSPTKWTLQGSNDAINWNDVDLQSGQSTWAYGQVKAYQVNGIHKYTIWRLVVYRSGATGNEHIAIGELAFFAPEFR